MFVAIFGFVFGFLACCVLEKPLAIIATSFGGSWMVVQSIIIFAGGFNIESNAKFTTWQEWTAFAGMLIMFVSGLIVQLVMYCRGEKKEENKDKKAEKKSMNNKPSGI